MIDQILKISRDPGRPFRALGLFIAALLGLHFALEGFAATAPQPVATPSINADGAVPAPTFSPSPVPGAQASPSAPPVKTVTPKEARSLSNSFSQAQRSELKALDHRHKFELRELEASQSARMKEWTAKENAARKKFFEAHSEGAKRREYVKDLRERRNSLKGIFKDEKSQRQREQDARKQSVKQDQAQKQKEFNEVLGHGERPPEWLWPSGR